jgi:hypothetical protein
VCGEQLDGVIGLGPPEPGLAGRRPDHVAVLVEQPRPRLVTQERPPVMADHQLLAEAEWPVDGRVDDLSFAAPDSDQGQQDEAVGVQLRTLPQVRGVPGNRQIGELGHVLDAGVLCALRSDPQCLVAAGTAGGCHVRDHRLIC